MLLGSWENKRLDFGISWASLMGVSFPGVRSGGYGLQSGACLDSRPPHRGPRCPPLLSCYHQGFLPVALLPVPLLSADWILPSSRRTRSLTLHRSFPLSYLSLGPRVAPLPARS
eukprot:IDg7134t1